MDESRPFSQLNNKCELIGRILAEPTLRYDERTDQQIMTFVLAVSRDGLPMTWNKDEYNYFVCRLAERLVGGEKIIFAQNMLKIGRFVKVEGILESKPYTDRHIKSRSLNLRATQAFNNFVLVVDWSDGRPYIENLEKMRAETMALRNIFGTDVDINWQLVDKGDSENEKDNTADLPDF